MYIKYTHINGLEFLKMQASRALGDPRNTQRLPREFWVPFSIPSYK